MHKIGRDLVRDMLESAVAAAVAGRVGRRRVADGRRGRAPHIARFVVAQIEGFAATVANGIVRPRGELVLATVDGPGVAAALGSRLEPECRIGDDVDPRRRRRLARSEDRHVLGAVVGKAAEPVEEFEVGRAVAGTAAPAARRRVSARPARTRQARRCARAAQTGRRAAPAARPARRTSRRARVSAGIKSARSTKTPPAGRSAPGCGRDWLALTSVSMAI